jgi:hypothetical protein
MAKGKKQNRNSTSGWTANDHNAQADQKRRKNEKTALSQPANVTATTTTDTTTGSTVRRLHEDRTAHLTHNTREKRDAAKLQLHIAKVQRELKDLKQRLSNWDPVREAKRKEEILQNERSKIELEAGDDPKLTKKRRGRLGPESWKLRGAARPAWEVYDFDTRYIDPHVKEHERAAAAVARSQNLLITRTTPGDSKGQKQCLLHTVAPDEGREYLGLLMQLGYLSQEAKQYKTARGTFLECIELEGDDLIAAGSANVITAARDSLMRMYLDLQRFDAAFQLGERFTLDGSCTIRFSMAVLAIQLEKDEHVVNDLIIQAIKSNIFATYYLCYYETFIVAMEFTEEFHDAEDEPQSTFEEALEYCSSSYGAHWHKTKGAIATLQRILHQNQSDFSPSDLDWKDRLSQIESQYLARRGRDNKDFDESGDDLHYSGQDIPMFAGMFRTAMDMVNDSELAV